MGGINDYSSLAELAKTAKSLKLKVALYSGHNSFNSEVEPHLDYYKIGPFIPECGPLNKKTTNQRFYKKENNK